MPALELEKQISIPIDRDVDWGTIDIRLVVTKKAGQAAEQASSAEDEIDDFEREETPGKGPLDSYLEKPKGKGYVVFLLNGQRHDFLDETFVSRELDFKYLKNRTMIAVDVDGLRPEAIGKLIQGSRQGFYRGDIFSAIVARISSVLKSDPDLKRLEAQAEQDIAELTSGDAAVKNKLDELIEGHHALGSGDKEGSSGPVGTQQDGISSESTTNAGVVVHASDDVGKPADGPVLVAEPSTAVVRLHPDESKTITFSVLPAADWDALTSFEVLVSPAVPELKITNETYGASAVSKLLFSEPEDFPAEDYPVITTVRGIARFKNSAEPRLAEKELIISQKRPRKPTTPPTLRPVPTFLRVISRQPVKLLAGGPHTHVRLRWDGEDELTRTTPPEWSFTARCTTLDSFPKPVFSQPRNGAFEILLDTPIDLTPGQTLMFQVEATGPHGALLAAPFMGVVALPVAENELEPRLLDSDLPSGGGVRRPPYQLKEIHEPEWRSAQCWGSPEWTGADVGCFEEPTQSTPLTLIINQDAGLLKGAIADMISRKLEERTVKDRRTRYTIHVAFHLWQMYMANQEKKKQAGQDNDIRELDEQEMRAEIMRVAATLIKLMDR